MKFTVINRCSYTLEARCSRAMPNSSDYEYDFLYICILLVLHSLQILDKPKLSFRIVRIDHFDIETISTRSFWSIGD